MSYSRTNTARNLATVTLALTTAVLVGCQSAPKVLDPKIVELPNRSTVTQARRALEKGNAGKAREIAEAALPYASAQDKGRLHWLAAQAAIKEGGEEHTVLAQALPNAASGLLLIGAADLVLGILAISEHTDLFVSTSLVLAAVVTTGGLSFLATAGGERLFGMLGL